MASSTVTHFISPVIIDVDDVNSKVEAVIDFVPIPVHAAYMCDVTLSLKCVNISPVLNESSYQIQDLDGTPLSASDIAQKIEQLLPYLKHADVSGSLVIEPDLLGSKLSVLNNNLANMLNPTNASDRLGNFSVKKEVLKTISSYLTNHTSLSLVDTITDISGAVSSQLNASNHIANELKRFETVELDTSGDDTKPFLNTFLDLNNANEIFGENTVNTVIFIVASKVKLDNDPTQNTGIQTSSVSAINSIDYREMFTDELGDPLQPQISSDRLDGKWYAAICFNIAPSNTFTNVITSGPKANYTVEYHDFPSGNLILKNSTRTDTNGFVYSDPTFVPASLYQVYTYNEDGTGYDVITNRSDADIFKSVHDFTDTLPKMTTELTSIFTEYAIDQNISDISTLLSVKSTFQTKLSSQDDFVLDINPYDASYKESLANEISLLTLATEILSKGLDTVFPQPSEGDKVAKIRLEIAKEIINSSSVVDFTSQSFIENIFDNGIAAIIAVSPFNSTERTNIINGILIGITNLKTIYDAHDSNVDTLESLILDLHENFMKSKEEMNEVGKDIRSLSSLDYNTPLTTPIVESINFIYQSETEPDEIDVDIDLLETDLKVHPLSLPLNDLNL
tara:strand:+ start:553 stop:2418 length:1866 start_codon:yes stop_codon:yes gene_type:complete